MSFSLRHILPVLFFTAFLLPAKADEADLMYEYRIAQLNRLSPVELEYNAEVRRYIDLFTGPRKQDMARIIGLSKLYFPLFEEALDRLSLPHELKYLTVIESGLNPLATSKSGAVGLWQFMLNTGRLFDLEVTSYIDERRDPWQSTDAACKYLAYLHNTFHDWNLVMASYNGGPGEVRKAIERSKGETDYWKIRPYLSEQAKHYVPAFIATFYLMNFYTEHGIVPIEPAYHYQQLDTLHIRYPVTFSQISQAIGLDVAHIRMLNPVYKRDYIIETKPWALLVLPADKIQVYLQNENRILGYVPPLRDYHLMVQQSVNTEGMTKLVHVVKPGEVTHKIAMNYNCTLENIRIWNNLPGFEVKSGQELVIWVRKSDE